LLIGCASSGASSSTVTSEAEPIDDALQQAADEFKTLRPIKGQFDGGEWNAEVDQWMGRKHKAMIVLGERLGSGAFSRQQIIDLLGAPDDIARQGDPLTDLIERVSPEYAASSDAIEFLVHYWRGEHDFLFFACQEDVIIGLGWWHAGE
jgi:hypothetical protein